jgi:hypothetical protein
VVLKLEMTESNESTADSESPCQEPWSEEVVGSDEECQSAGCQREQESEEEQENEEEETALQVLQWAECSVEEGEQAAVTMTNVKVGMIGTWS